MAEKPLNEPTEENQSAAQSNIDVGKIEVGGNVDGNIIMGNNNVINMTPEQQVIRSLHQLPPAPADFTGREELINLLIADFEKGKGATITGQPIHGLTGMGGIGKTSLGLVVVHRIAEDYPDAQIFLDLKGATSPLSVIEVMRHVLLSFEPTIDLRTLDETNMSAACQSAFHGKKVLLFLDNARSAEQIASLRPPETCAMLVTSRWTFSVPGLRTHRVGVMNEEDAKDFLLELCPRIGDAEQAAAELAKACVYMPLALRIAGSFLQVNGDWPVEKYLTQLKDRRGKLATFGQSREDAELIAEPDLIATFELSYHHLSEENRERWRMLGVFPASFDASAASAMWDLDEDTTRKLLGSLYRYSLLDYDETSSRYSLHDLLADFSLTKMEEEEEMLARIAHAVYYSQVLENIQRMYDQGSENIILGLRLYDAEWMNIEAGQHISAVCLEKSREAAQACNWYAGQGSINRLRLKPKYRIKWIEDGIRAARVLRNRKAEGAHLGNLGRAYADLGEAHKAIQFYEQSLVILREIGDRRDEGNALNNLGMAYKNLGEAHKAIQFYEQALVIYGEIGDRRGEGAALTSLGSAYRNLGNARKAIEFYEQALRIIREIGDRPGEGNALVSLGNAYADLGDVRKAIEYYEQALVIYGEIGDSRGEGLALNNLGNAYKNLGEAHKAIQFYERALVILREIGDRDSEAYTLDSLASAYGEFGEARKAIELFEQALVILREIGDRRAEALVSWNLGLVYKKEGKLDKAIQAMQILADFEREISHPDAETHAAKLEELRKKLRERGQGGEGK